MLGPPSCDYCNVWLKLNEHQLWRCPVCETDGGTAYKNLKNGWDDILPDEAIPLLKFIRGKDNGID
jgi:hypothetical protein